MFQTCPWTAGASKRLCTLVMVAYELLLGYRLISPFNECAEKNYELKRLKFCHKKPEKESKMVCRTLLASILGHSNT